MVAYLKVAPRERTYSNYLHMARKAEKEEAMEVPCTKTIDNASKPKVMSLFLLRKLNVMQLTKTRAVQWAHLEEEAVDQDEEAGDEESDGINGMPQKFMVCLTQAMKVAQ